MKGFCQLCKSLTHWSCLAHVKNFQNLTFRYYGQNLNMFRMTDYSVHWLKILELVVSYSTGQQCISKLHSLHMREIYNIIINTFSTLYLTNQQNKSIELTIKRVIRTWNLSQMRTLNTLKMSQQLSIEIGSIYQ